jgi:hypothetical protein
VCRGSATSLAGATDPDLDDELRAFLEAAVERHLQRESTSPV